MKPAFDPLAQRYVSARYPIYARGGMVNHSGAVRLPAPADTQEEPAGPQKGTQKTGGSCDLPGLARAEDGT